MSCNEQVKVIAVSGGPCGGKTTLLSKVMREFAITPNTKTFLVEEASTLLQRGGINFVDAGRDESFQRHIITTQLALENVARKTATRFVKDNPGYTAVVICDRGIMDGEAYFDEPAEFEKILSSMDLDKKSVFKRYDGIVFLRSAANGAADFYTTANNEARTETIEEATALDQKTYNAWKEHPHFYEVDNSFRFIDKLDHAMQIIYELAGIRLPKKHHKRYIIEPYNLIKLIRDYPTLLSTEKIFFLKNRGDMSDVEMFVKLQKANTTVNYSLTTRRFDTVQVGPDDSQVVSVYDSSESITEKQFVHYIRDADSNIGILERTIISFSIDEKIRANYEVYSIGSKDYIILDATMDGDSYENILFNTFKIVKDITTDTDYSEIAITMNGRALFEKAYKKK